MLHVTPAVGVPAATSFVLAILSIYKEAEFRKADARATAAEKDRRDEFERSKEVRAERMDLATENKALRTDMRAELERLKDEVIGLRHELSTALADASTWKDKYEREVASNLPRDLEVQALRKQVSELTDRVGRNEAAAVA